MVFLLAMFGSTIDPFVLDDRAFWMQPWRLFTTALPHGGPAHLIFNLFWCWALGAYIEHFFGRVAWLWIVIVSAVASAAAQYAFTIGGIGLSGIVYGMWAALWAVGKVNPRYRGIIDRRTSGVFVAWFFVCIVTTWMGWMRVANISHGVGAIVGGLIGAAIGTAPPRRIIFASLAAVLTGLSLAGASVWRIQLNLNRTQIDAMKAGDLLQSHKPAEAIPLLERIAAKEPDDAWTIYSLALAYHATDRDDDAIELISAAAKRGKVAVEERNELADLAVALGDAHVATNLFAARDCYDMALLFAPDHPEAWLRQARFAGPATDRQTIIDGLVRVSKFDNESDDLREALREMRSWPDR